MLKYYISILKGDSRGHAQNKGRCQKHREGGGPRFFSVQLRPKLNNSVKV